MDQYPSMTYSDPKREQEFGECNILIDPPEPNVQFDSELQPKSEKLFERQGQALYLNQVTPHTK